MSSDVMLCVPENLHVTATNEQKTLLTFCSCLNRALVCLFLRRRWRRWTWTSGRTSGGRGPGRIPGTIRSSSGADRTNRAELHGHGADLMAVGGASGSSENRLCFVLDQVFLAFGSKEPTSGSFGLFAPKHHLLAADCLLWPSDDYLRKQPVGGASVPCITSPFCKTIFINLWISRLNKFCVIDAICLVFFKLFGCFNKIQPSLTAASHRFTGAKYQRLNNWSAWRFFGLYRRRQSSVSLTVMTLQRGGFIAFIIETVLPFMLPPSDKARATWGEPFVMFGWLTDDVCCSVLSLRNQM